MLRPGTIVAGYRIDGVVGEGGMAVVYRATQLSLARVVALKVIAPELGDDPSFRARFKREGQLQAALDHDHIVSVHEAGESEHGLFLAMRLIAGPTVKDLILSGQLDARRSLRLLAQVAQALDTAHQAGLIHRDVKPQNILVGKADHAYLADFGLTKAIDDTTRLTGTGQFLGTIDYVSPEQLQGEPATAASDCYSFTAVLYECLTGQVPFLGSSEAAVMHAHLVKPPPRVTAIRPDLPAAMDEVVARGMAKDRDARPSSATELLGMATRALASEPAPTIPRGQPTRLTPPSADGPGAVVGGAGAQTTRVPDTGARVASQVPAASTAPAGVTRAAQTEAAAPPLAPAGDAPHIESAAERPRARIGAPAASVAALAALAIAGGFVLGRSGAKAGTARVANSATVGHIELHYPSHWEVSSRLPAIPGMSLSEPLMLATVPALTGLIAGENASAAGPTLLPLSFRTRLANGLPAGDPVHLGGAEAYRYGGLHVRGLSGELTVYVVPTSAGVATIACWGSTRLTAAGEAECARIASTLQLVGAASYPLGPSAAYAGLLSRTFSRLRTASSGPLVQSRTASSSSTQANAEQQLASAFAKAAADLGAAAIPPTVRDAHAALVDALRRLASGYARGAAAAQSAKAAAYRSAGQEVASASAAVSKALHSLDGLGYTVRT